MDCSKPDHVSLPVTPGRGHSSGDDVRDQRRMVEALGARLCAADSAFELIETHISFVLLANGDAYKIKKAVTLPFLDFGTLAARRRYCQDELRLNRRLAPDLYRDVVPITGTCDAPAIGGTGRILDYAVRMRRFPDDALLSDVLARNALAPAHVDALAVQVARFHARASVAPPHSSHGDPAEILELALDNVSDVEGIDAAAHGRDLEAIRTWTRREHAAIRSTLERRRNDGAIRECHGDLHLGNIALFEGNLAIFDCIEFSEAMRWIDVMSEVAFTMMDFEHRGRRDLAYRFLNAYCEQSGDYAGVRVLRYYLVYRAMVRAKVACLRARQLDEADRQSALGDFAAHLRLASAYAHMPPPVLGLMHGPSGCGKTTLAGHLVERAGAIRVRSDVERKRLAGLAAAARSGSSLASGLYAADATARTYERLHDCAKSIVAGGFAVLVDATSLLRAQRAPFRDLARTLGAPFVIVDCVASLDVLKARVSARAREGRDASEADVAVLEHQMSSAEPLSCDERRYTVACDADSPFDTLPARSWQHLIDRLHRPDAPPGPVTIAAPPDGDLARRVGFLAVPASFQPATGVVEPIETHLSWVFLTDDHAYKLKKPVRDELVDLRSVEDRRRNGADQLRVNGRFSTDVYLDVVPLASGADARLRLGGDGEIVDWLVRMRRLPAERMLDRAIARGRLDAASLASVVEGLCRVYAQFAVRVDERAYRRGIVERIATFERALLEPRHRLPADLVQRTVLLQRAFTDLHRDFDERVRLGCIVEGHGDLRPEHVCLDAAPQIIDALEASREHRILDKVDELGFLALECERLGAPQAAAIIFDAYRRCTADPVPDRLIHFYQGFRALARARLAIRHLDDESVRDAHRWPALARRYLDLAAAHAERSVHR